MIVVIVEDNNNWRNQLALMYSRILSDSKEVKDYHKDIKLYATAQEAIEYFKPSGSERSNASPKVDVLSLDLNLGREGGATGFDVLDSAVNAGQKFVTIVVSGFGVDKDLHEQLGTVGTDRLIELETKVAAQTKAKCFIHEKKDENTWTVPDQVNALEKRLRAQVHGNSNVLRDWTKALRGTAANLNGKILCLHFELPKELMGSGPGTYIPGVLTRKTWILLSKVSAWHKIFEKIDQDSTPSDLLTRLLFLVTSGKNYLTGLSLRPTNELIDPQNGQYAAPSPKGEWICPRGGDGIISLTPRESFQLLQLVFQKRLENKRETMFPKAQYSKDGQVDYENVAAPSTMSTFDLEVSGILGNNTLTTPGRQSLKNGDSLELKRYIPNHSGGLEEVRAVKTTRCLLNNRLKEILRVDYDLITAVGTPFKTYTLQIPGFIYIQCEGT